MQKVEMKLLQEDFDNFFDSQYHTLDTLGEGAHAIVKKVISRRNPD